MSFTILSVVLDRLASRRLIDVERRTTRSPATESPEQQREKPRDRAGPFARRSHAAASTPRRAGLEAADRAGGVGGRACVFDRRLPRVRPTDVDEPRVAIGPRSGIGASRGPQARLEAVDPVQAVGGRDHDALFTRLRPEREHVEPPGGGPRALGGPAGTSSMKLDLALRARLREPQAAGRRDEL